MEISLAELIRETGGDIQGDPEKIISGIAPFDAAGPNDITFADSPKILKRIDESLAGAVLVPENVLLNPSVTLVRSKNPRLAFAKIMHLFSPGPMPSAHISPLASIGEQVSLGEGVSIGPFAVIEDHAVIGSRVKIHPHVVIGAGAIVGDDVTLYPHVTILSRCKIGSRVVIHAGTVIGSDGFGFVPEGRRHFKIPQLGIVQIDDDVEIGACNTIDRATFGRTWIKKGTKTDNHVQIAHNVTIGENTLIVAQVGIAGSTTVGSNVILAGQAGIAGHIVIGDGVTVGPQAGVTRSLPAGQVVSGTPEMPHPLWLRISQILPRLPELKRKINDLEKRLDALNEKMP